MDVPGKARPRPMSRGNLCVEPPPGTSPTAISGCSLWIMTNLNDAMMPAAELMRMQR
jgi:hypothetical protein